MKQGPECKQNPHVTKFLPKTKHRVKSLTATFIGRGPTFALIFRKMLFSRCNLWHNFEEGVEGAALISTQRLEKSKKVREKSQMWMKKCA